MPRNPRTSSQTDFFHVITQGIEKHYIFNNPEDIRFYISFMNKTQQKYNIEVIAYCIMNNHTHALIKTSKIDALSKFMQSINTTYAKYYNTKYKRVGYVFRNRFKSEGIYSEKQLYSCINYIYNNPVKAGICKNPAEYPFSNYKKIDITYIDDDIVFIDVEEDNLANTLKTIENFLKKNNITLEYLKKNELLFKELIKILRDKYGISFRQMNNIFKCSREKIRKIYNN